MATRVLRTVNAEQEQRQSQWSTAFPTTCIVTEQQSLLFVKKLVAVGISSITYLRVLFPENAYTDQFIENLNLKILRDDVKCPAASTLISWVHGCFEAIEMKYLRQLTLAFAIGSSEDCNILETYSFHFSYSDSGIVNMEAFNASVDCGHISGQTSEIRRPTIKMLHTLILLTQTLRQLPKDFVISMKLLYYDHTPLDYEPPGFHSSKLDNYNFKEDHVTFKVGEVETAFHTVKFRCKVRRQLMEDESIAEPVQKKNNFIGFDEQCANSFVFPSTSTPELPFKRSAEMKCRTSLPSSFLAIRQCKSDYLCSFGGSVNSSYLEPAETPVIKSEFPIRCPCNINIEQGMMLICSGCGFWQHGACFTIIDEYIGPDYHFCNICALHPSICTDPLLCVGDAHQIQQTCIFRRALVIIRDMDGSVTASKISDILGVNFMVGSGVIDKMLSINVLKRDTLKKCIVINREILLKTAFPKYLNKIGWQSPSDEKSTPVNAVSIVSSPIDTTCGSANVYTDSVELFKETPLHGTINSKNKHKKGAETPSRSCDLGKVSVVLKDLRLNNYYDFGRSTKIGNKSRGVIKKEQTASCKRSSQDRRIIISSSSDSGDNDTLYRKRCPSSVKKRRPRDKSNCQPTFSPLLTRSQRAKRLLDLKEENLQNVTPLKPNWDQRKRSKEEKFSCRVFGVQIN